MASLGNLSENPHIGLLMVDFVEDLIGLHVNGAAHDPRQRRASPRSYPGDTTSRGDRAGRRAERWVVVEVDEAYIHCRKHIPRMQRLPQNGAWGTDDPARKGGDYFGAARRGAPRLPTPSRRPASAGREPGADPEQVLAARSHNRGLITRATVVPDSARIRADMKSKAFCAIPAGVL